MHRSSEAVASPPILFVRWTLAKAEPKEVFMIQVSPSPLFGVPGFFMGLLNGFAVTVSLKIKEKPTEMEIYKNGYDNVCEA